MSDPMTDPFTRELGLASPWRVAQVRFQRAVQEIRFDVVCEAKRLPCRALCGPGSADP